MTSKTAAPASTAGADPRLAGAPAEIVAAYNRLSTKLRAFAIALPMAGSQMEAALQAGYAAKTAKASASMFAANPDVKLVHDYLVGKTMRAAAITLDRCMSELAKLAFGDPQALFGENGELLPPSEWPAGASAMVSEIQQVDLLEEGRKIGQVNKIKFVDKHAALRTALQLIDAFPEKKKKIEINKRVGVVVVPAKATQGGSRGEAIEGEATRIEQPLRQGNAPGFMVRKFKAPEPQD